MNALVCTESGCFQIMPLHKIRSSNMQPRRSCMEPSPRFNKTWYDDVFVFQGKGPIEIDISLNFCISS